MGDVAATPGINNVHLDRLADHDLLVRIAARLDTLPCGNERERLDQLEHRTGVLEQAVAAMQVKGGVVAVLGTALATVLGIVVKP